MGRVERGDLHGGNWSISVVAAFSKANGIVGRGRDFYGEKIDDLRERICLG